MNNKTLLIIFVALVAIYALTQLGSKKEIRSFKTDLVAIDTATVSKIIFKTKTSPEEILMQKTNGQWNMTRGSLTVPCSKASVNGLLGQVQEIKSVRPAATKEEKWIDFEVDEKSGSPIKFYAGDELLAEFVVGRYSVDQRRQTMESFIRLPDEPIVYATNSYLPLSLQAGFDGFRDKTIAAFDASKVYQLSYNDNGNESTLNLQNGVWKAGELVKDSTEIATWIAKVSNFKGSEFLEDAGQLSGAAPIKTINIKGDKTVDINLYLNTSGAKPFVIQSSQNKSAYFQSDSTGLYKSLFEDIKAVF